MQVASWVLDTRVTEKGPLTGEPKGRGVVPCEVRGEPTVSHIEI